MPAIAPFLWFNDKAVSRYSEGSAGDESNAAG